MNPWFPWIICLFLPDSSKETGINSKSVSNAWDERYWVTHDSHCDLVLCWLTRHWTKSFPNQIFFPTVASYKQLMLHLPFLNQDKNRRLNPLPFVVLYCHLYFATECLDAHLIDWQTPICILPCDFLPVEEDKRLKSRLQDKVQSKGLSLEFHSLNYYYYYWHPSRPTNSSSLDSDSYSNTTQDSLIRQIPFLTNSKTNPPSSSSLVSIRQQFKDITQKKKKSRSNPRILQP